MFWSEEMPLILRGLLQDHSIPPKYADDRLIEMILIAARTVQRQVQFRRPYLSDIVEKTIDPDPADPEDRDEDFINLTCLKAACMLVTAEVREFTAQGVSIRDGSSSLSLSRNPKSLEIMQGTYCEELENAIYEYKVGGSGAGEAILSPFKPGHNRHLSPRIHRE